MARSFLVCLLLCFSMAACGDNSPTLLSQNVLTFEAAAQPTVPPTPSVQLSPATAITPRSSQDEDNIRETILRYRFAKTSSEYAGQSAFPWKYYCLGSGTTQSGVTTLQDLPQSFLDRFKGNTPPVVKASDCAMVEDKVFVKKAVLKTGGIPARFWAVSAVTWLSDSHAELEASHQGDFGDAGGQVFQLERQNGSWKVTGSTLTWVA